MSDHTKEARDLVRMRKWLIATGVPLAVFNLGLGLWFGGIFGISAALGTYIAMRVVGLICERHPHNLN